MTYVKNTTFYKLKRTAKNTLFRKIEERLEESSNSKRNTYIKLYEQNIFAKFRYMLYYCRPTMDLCKKKLLE